MVHGTLYKYSFMLKFSVPWMMRACAHLCVCVCVSGRFYTKRQLVSLQFVSARVGWTAGAKYLPNADEIGCTYLHNKRENTP